MNKKQKEKIENMYYGETIEKKKDEQEKQEKKKIKEREKRIKEINKNRRKEQDKFDLDTETVIGMTNNKKIKNQQVQRKNEKNERIRAKRNKKIKRIVKFTSLFAIIIGGAIFAFVSPIFNIQEIEIAGNKELNKDIVESLSNLNKGQNIFQFMNKQVEMKIKENPYIENVEIRRKIPNKVQIKIEERQKEFNIEFMNSYAYIDKQGNILEIGENKLELPVIQGIKMQEDDIKAGNRLKKEDLEKLETVNQIINLWEINKVGNQITSIDVTNKLEYTMIIEKEKKKVYLGDNSNLNDKILWTQAIINDNKNIEGEIFVNGDLNNKFKPRFKQKV